MNYIVFDLEWNQKTADVRRITDPVYLSGEIIEIGAVKLDSSFRAVEEFRVYVLPQFYTSMNEKVVRLTKIHGNYLEKHGIPFPEACRRFQNWCGEDYAFMTWSQSDLPMLVDNMLLHHMDVSHLPVCYDIQRIFDYEIMRSDRQYSLDAALEFWGEHGDASHDALHDARNTVRICDHLDLDAYIEEYASQAFAEPPQSQIYESLGQILADEDLLSFPCPYCGQPVKCEGWIQLHSYRFMAAGFCPDGDEFILFLTRSKTDNSQYRISRMLYEMSDDLWDFYQDKLEQKNFVSVSA